MVEAPEHGWLYYRVYVADVTEMQLLLEQVLRPILLPLGTDWFFLQFQDATGLHLRLRLRGRHGELAVLERTLETEFADAGLEYAKCLYAPEYHKFGEGEGMRMAERIFCAGSRAALSCAGPRQRSLRLYYGAAHTALMVAPLPPQERRCFLHQNSWYWYGGPLSRTVRPRAPVNADQTAPLLSQIGHVLQDDDARAALTGYAEEAWRQLRAPERAHVQRTDTFLLFHHIHLMNNRLGIFRSEEAAISRLLWSASADNCHALWSAEPSNAS
ncbi:thiopeptide-type bacteriocin biosynthesis protein [Nonomuraea sp. NPDC000554]|uniref:thiopeptide-type bacteriocin biosynthesis protein n=1 Tax=Nonomuraea sp. NPDC000554 TaxID=3154259 RepID=UPI00332E5EBB